MSGTHARIAPSSLDRIVHCPGSVQLVEAHGLDPETDEQREGDAAHWVALKTAEGKVVLAGMQAPNGVEVDQEMIYGGKMYARVVGTDGYRETHIPIPRIHPEHCAGTPDHFKGDVTLADQTTGLTQNVLRVNDYKYGHLFVEVFECWQLIAYALGIIDMWRWADSDTLVIFTIVQPRSYHKDGPVRVWKVQASELRALANVAEMAAAEALGPNPRTQAGPQCTFCPARIECRTYQLSAGFVYELAGRAEKMPLGENEIGSELRFVMRAMELLKGRATGLSAQAEALLRAGKRVPYFKLDSTVGDLAWTKPVGEIIAIGDLWDKDLRKPAAVITPTQAIKAGIDRSVIDSYALRPAGPLKLVADDTTAARKVFSGNKS